ncbi:aKG-HExxH-type peptide beta-hydroxylase [Streptomyces sp. NPDC088253]|uniref:aKG-HExxH-type peptide beta-hydroxylase n=1 Tax=Streptomyces sp. NPDC088253 TaxID=3365846 RepID=UPI003830ECAD
MTKRNIAGAGIVGQSNPSCQRSCWQLRGNKDRWYRKLERAMSSWSPPALLGLDVEAVRETLMSAALRRESWLLHPCATVIIDEGERPASAHARLAVWAAANVPSSTAEEMGGLTLDAPTWVWGHQGSFILAPGTQRLRETAEHAGSSPSVPVSLPVPDPWGDSFVHREEFGDLAEHAWWNRTALPPEGEARLAADIHALLRAEHALAAVLPDAAAWVTDVTRVVVPLAGSPTPSGSFRSGTLAGLPGVALIEVTTQPLLVMEALVHESAHLHFHLEETEAPFFEESDTRLYDSPLRPDPRPLRGIFLAYHALGYMCAMYEDWLSATGDGRCAEALEGLRGSRDDARATLERAAADGLTEDGRRFLRLCEEYVDRELPT